MGNDSGKKIVIQEGYVQKGEIIGNPTSPRPNITVQGIGGGSTTPNGNTGGSGGPSGQGNQGNSSGQ